MHFDHGTAVGLLNEFMEENYVFLLESATAGPGSIARFSFLGFDPLWIYQSADGKGSLKNASGDIAFKSFRGDPFLELHHLISDYQIGFVGDLAPSVREALESNPSGAFGYFGYDSARYVEPVIGQVPKSHLNLPDAVFFVPQSYLVFDQLRRSLSVVRYLEVGKNDDSTSRKAKFEAAEAQLNSTLKRIRNMASSEIAELKTRNEPLDYSAATASNPEDRFLSQVDRCMDEIRSGEIFQIQIGNRLSLKTDARPFEIFRHLRVLNPSPYMFYYKFEKDIILGSSPEMMVGVDGSRVTHRPIAGTRKRTWNSFKDQVMRTELETSEKERAEHVMLVDLSRNDIGRISAPGTVQVEDLMVVEEYSHVFHLVSQVTGELQPNLNAFDAMRYSFPNGTVSGAPKIRAMQLIYEIEPCSREFYAGSLGVFEFNGNLKSTLLIRTMHWRDGIVSTQASAGIVYDSIPEQEWLETRNKMAACLTAMQNTEAVSS